MKQYIHLTIILSALGLIISSVYATPISYPIAPPDGEVLSGTFQRYFTNMYSVGGNLDTSGIYTT